MSKPTLAVDFDGVINSYISGWVDSLFIPDPPTAGAFEFLLAAMEHFEVVICTSRVKPSLQDPDGKFAKYVLLVWMGYWAKKEMELERANHLTYYFRQWDHRITSTKPGAAVTLDDRVCLFTGTFPSPAELLKFKPWNK